MLSELFDIGKILDCCEKICYFLAVNLLFIISCFPVLLFFMFIGISQTRTYLPLFMLGMTAVPPAFCAALYAMKRVADDRARNAWKDYWHGYLSDWKQKYMLGAAHMFIIFILWTNIEFFTKQTPFLPAAVIFILLFACAVIVTPNLYLIASRYDMRNMDIAKIACILTVTRPGCTLGTTAALGVMLVFLEISAGTAVLFMVSIYSFLVVFISRGILASLEQKNK